MLRLAHNLEVPDDGVTQTWAFLARKGAGKTYAAGKLVEELHRIGAPFIVLDPVGNWRGLCLASDGRRPGLDVAVLGPEPGDVPITAGQGDRVASVLLDRNVSAVIDVSAFRSRERDQFVADFAESLFHAAKRQRTARTIILEEAQLFAPQRVGRADARLLRAVEDIVRLGRNYGLGSVLISQRPQSVHKEVLSQVEALFVGQLSAPQERKAIADWVVEHGTHRKWLDELPSLPVGTMVLWSPQWLRKLVKVRIAKKRTFDASATPELGAKLQRVRAMTQVDVAGLRADLEQSPVPTKDAKASANTSRLERRNAELETEVRQLRALALQRKQESDLLRVLSTHLRAAGELAARLEQLYAGAAPKLPAASQPAPHPARAPATPRAQAHRPAAIEGPDAPRPGLRAGAMRMQAALATFYPGTMTRAQVARAAKMKVTGGTFATYWSELKKRSFVEELAPQHFRATVEGLEALGSSRPIIPLTFEARQAFWNERLRAGERRIQHKQPARHQARRPPLRTPMALARPQRDGVKLTRQKNFRLSEAEAERLAEHVKKSGLTESQWLRIIALTAMGETTLLEQQQRVAPQALPSTPAAHSSKEAESPPLDTFGKRLRHMRKTNGFRRQEDLANALGISTKTVNRHETADHPPPAGLRALKAYARAFKVSEQWLVYGDAAPPDHANTFGDRLRQARKARGFRSQKDLGKALGLSPKTVYRHETAEHVPTGRDTLQAYARALQVSEQWLAYGDSRPMPATPGRRRNT